MRRAEIATLARVISMGLGASPRRKFSILLALTLLSTVMAASLPVIFGEFITRIEEQSIGPTAVAAATITYCGFFLSNGLINEIRSLVFGLTDNTSFRNISNEAYMRALQMPYDYHLREETGVTWERIDMGAESGSTIINQGLGGLVPYSIQVILSVAALSYLFGPWMGFLMAGTITVFLLISYVGTLRLKSLQREIVVNQSTSVATAINTLQSIETVIAFGASKEVTAPFSDALGLYWTSVRRYLNIRFVLGACGQIVLSIALFIAFMVPLVAIEGESGLSDYVIINMYFLQLAIPLDQMTKNYFAVVDAVVRLQRLIPFWVAPTEEATLSSDRKLTYNVNASAISLERNGRTIIEQTSICIPFGQAVAIVGSSGAGKSTLCHLLCGVARPSTGSILLGDVPLHVIRPIDRQRAVGLVPQSVPIFDSSLLFNVTIGRAGPREKVTELLQISGLSDLLERVNGDLSVGLGDGGLRVSGGEAQRLGIARALYLDPAILVLDEATANLDSFTEQGIIDIAKRRRAARSTIIVTHKLSLVKWVDRILYVDSGRIIEDGTHDDLMSLGGSYASLWSEQVLE